MFKLLALTLSGIFLFSGCGAKKSNQAKRQANLKPKVATTTPSTPTESANPSTPENDPNKKGNQTEDEKKKDPPASTVPSPIPAKKDGPVTAAPTITEAVTIPTSPTTEGSKAPSVPED